MGIRFLLVCCMLIMMAGCATTNTKEQDLQAQRLQGRVNYLEQELQNKDKAIIFLQNELSAAKETSASPSYQKAKSHRETPSMRLSKKQIQKALKKAGFYKGPVDGRLGPKSRKAIKEFQKANGLRADGVVGKRTREKLGKYL